MSNLKFTPSQAISLSIVLMTIGTIILLAIGLLNGNLLATQAETQIMITKSPTQIIYKGPSEEHIVSVLQEIKDIPFSEYSFNTQTRVLIDDDIIPDPINLSTSIDNIVNDTNLDLPKE